MSQSGKKDQLDFFRDGPEQGAPERKRQTEKSKACTRCRERYLTDHEVAVRFSTSRATIWRWVDKSPAFPTPVKLSPGTTRWKLSDLVRFEAQMVSEGTRCWKGKPAGGLK